MKPLNIALVRQRYTAFGGAERFVERAVAALRQDGTQITIITRDWPGESTNQALICNPPYLGSVWRDWGFARCVCTAVAEQSFDLVQSHERIPCCDIYRAGDGVHREWLIQRRRAASRWGRIKLGGNPYHAYMVRAEEAMFRSPKLRAVICISEMVKAEIMQHFGLPAAKLHVLYNGIDTERFHPRLREAHRSALRHQLGIPEDDTLCLFVGSGFERKGVGALLEALAELPPSVRAVVVGRDKKLAAYRRRAERLGLGTRVYFAGGQKDILPWYGIADLFVMPTLYEPFGNVILEAMACGLPVVTSTKCGGAELITPGGGGFVVDALDVAGLRDAIDRLCDPDLREATGQAARRRAEEFTLERMAREFSELYRSLLSD